MPALALMASLPATIGLSAPMASDCAAVGDGKKEVMLPTTDVTTGEWTSLFIVRNKLAPKRFKVLLPFYSHKTGQWGCQQLAISILQQVFKGTPETHVDSVRRP